ncbi:MAG: hypothetical protein PVF27_01765 [Gemmatimonadales bacterium]|jgi:hypothetical protein
MLISRNRGGPDRYVLAKALAYVVGVGLFLIGVRIDSDTVRWIAVAILLGGFALRLLPARQSHHDPPDPNP